MAASPPAVRRLLDRRTLAAAGVATLAVVAVAATPQLLGSRVASAFDGIDEANPSLLWLAGLGFLLSLIGNAGAWRSTLALCGARLSRGDANARYGIGSLVNSVAPARAGDAVRIALFSRTLPQRNRLLAAGGAFAALGAARALVLALLVLAGAAVGALPLWPLLVLGAFVGTAVAAAWFARGRRAQSRFAHALDAFRALGRDPRGGGRVVGWLFVSMFGRVGAAMAVCAALGVNRPLLAAIVIVPSLDLAGLFPITPGNVGLTSGAVAMALQAHGIGWTPALTAGIAFHAVEAAASILYGLGGVLYLSAASSTGTRRWLLVATAASAVLGVCGAFGATVIVPLV
jgi:uncharacterized membrane protein YbhN (UPF0104 family)